LILGPQGLIDHQRAGKAPAVGIVHPHYELLSNFAVSGANEITSSVISMSDEAHEKARSRHSPGNGYGGHPTSPPSSPKATKDK